MRAKIIIKKIPRKTEKIKTTSVIDFSGGFSIDMGQILMLYVFHLQIKKDCIPTVM